MAESAYLDNNATSALAPEVRAVMIAALDDWFANPSSQHRLGIDCRRVLEEARQTFANYLRARYATEVSFTSGATDAISQAFFRGCNNDIDQVLVSSVEHAAVLDAAAHVSPLGRPYIQIPVDPMGNLQIDQLERLLARGRSFVSVALVNNETGVIFDLPRISEACRRTGAILHVDAAQAAGRVPVDVQELKCDYLSLSPHKFHGPKGVGILYARAQASVHRERSESIRSGGTPNVPSILGAAAAISALSDWQLDVRKIERLRDRLEAAVLASIPESDVNGKGAIRVANTTNISFPDRNAADLVAALSRRKVYVSAGAACTSGGSPSHVIQAMGWGRARANSSLRFSLSKSTTEEEISFAIEKVVEAYQATLPAEEVAS